MEIRLDRNAFAAELAPMQGIVERKTTIPVLSHILLTARDGRLDLAATDLDVSLTSSCDAEADGAHSPAGAEADERHHGVGVALGPRGRQCDRWRLPDGEPLVSTGQHLAGHVVVDPGR